MKKKDKNENKAKNKAPVFIVEKDGKAYFKDRKMCLAVKPSTMLMSPKYPGYFWEFDYMEKLDWFKRYVALFLVNNGRVKFVNMTLDEFNELGGESIQLDGIERIDAKSLKKQIKF